MPTASILGQLYLWATPLVVSDQLTQSDSVYVTLNIYGRLNEVLSDNLLTANDGWYENCGLATMPNSLAFTRGGIVNISGNFGGS